MPLLVSGVIHALMIGTLFLNFNTQPEPKRLKPPSYVKATLVQLEAKTNRPSIQTPAPAPIVDDSKQKLEEKKREKEKQEQAALKRKEEQKKAEQQKKDEEKKVKEAEKKKAAEKKKKEAERKKREKEKALEEQARKKKEQEEAEQKRLQQLRAEQEALMAEQYATQVQSVEQAIFQRIADKWNQPPSARNGMRTELSISLLPNGMVTDVTVLKSSGNEAFDRSAVAAVKAVENFREVKELPIEIFNRNFRPLYIDFNPQNLRL